ncbi:MAG: Lrp/AsnC family transcriptional regulator [Pseudonocardia sp.]|nr:Lrp/AsnC family transcriptional regulator [Pseudonocardia sp.]
MTGPDSPPERPPLSLLDALKATEHRRRVSLDETDVRLLELLSTDGRLSNRALALDVGLTEATVAVRLRGLLEQRILHVGASLDWKAAGFRWEMHLLISTADRPVEEVGREVAALEGVVSVLVVFGRYDLIVRVLLADQVAAGELLHDRLSRIHGVDRVESGVVYETRKWTTRFASRSAVSRLDTAVDFPAPVTTLDTLDRALVDELLADGRRSNREIGRRLQVSEATVRVRLRRMEDAGLLRIRGQIDADKAGLVAAWAVVLVSTVGGSTDAVADELAAMPEVATVSLSTGRRDLILFVTAPTRNHLVRVVTQDIRGLGGVRSTETCEIIRTINIKYHWVRFLGD